jgi:Undecaprenyl-phosphate galactose phosphotransferase WbaP
VQGHLSRQLVDRVLVSRVDGSPNVWQRASSCLDWPGESTAVGLSPRLRPFKRAIDLAIALALVVPLLPLIGIISVLIRLSSPGPVIFKQERVGHGGRRFLCWKFRTMVCDGQRVLEDYLNANPERRVEWDRDHKLQYDPRVTTIGRLLRKTSLDELPQLWNVLRGEMSLVGPRPILASEIPDFGDHFAAFCSVMPGITGLWQVSGRNDTTYAEHVELDGFYARHWSLWLDLHILMMTFRVVLLRKGAC